MADRGKYIVIEGTDGTGKSTQADMLAERLQKTGIEVVQFHEPDGVEIASEIRTIIKNGNLARSAFTNVLLFTAARRENWLQAGLPTLLQGGWVVSSRDYTSTLAYQGYAEGFDIELIRELTRQATDELYMSPDFSIILDMDDEAERKKRIAGRGALEIPDTFESKNDDFQQKVIEGYRSIAAENSIPIVSAVGTPEEIHEKIWAIIQQDKSA